MPWKECSVMDERLKFVARVVDGESIAAVCRDFNISRKTGYKILNRYRDVGLHGLWSDPGKLDRFLGRVFRVYSQAGRSGRR